jgi:hypothetical protein
MNETRFYIQTFNHSNTNSNDDLFQIMPTIDTNNISPFFEFFVFCIENHYDNYTKQGIIYNLKLLGAKIQENVDENVTHLLLNYKNGTKYNKVNKKI